MCCSPRLLEQCTRLNYCNSNITNIWTIRLKNSQKKSKQRRTKKQTDKRKQGKTVKTVNLYEYVTSIQTFIALLQRPSELPHNALVVFS